MTDVFALIDEVFPGETKPAFVPPPTVPVERRDDAYGRRARSWCHKALEGKAEALAGLAEGSRNDTLNASAYLLLRYVQAGHLELEEVLATLREAAATCGLGNGEIEVTLGSSSRAATRDGPAEPPIGEGAPPDPFAELRVDPVTGEIAPPAELTPEQAAERRHQMNVAFELAQLRVRDEAKALFVAEQSARTFREPPSVLTLREQLLLPREPVRFTIADLLPRGGNVLLTAQFKAGKTTLMTSLLRSYADHTPFLGRFEVHPHAGRIAIFNYELSQQQYDEWLEQSGIVHQDRVSVLHLRGFRLDLRSPTVEDWIVGWLKDHDVSTWIADPFARAAVGVDENSNTEVGVWLDTFDVVKERAGVIDGVLSTHTGRSEMEHGQERARGATRLDDWADARWLLTKDEAGTRFFRATGRDVEVPEEKLTYDESTRALRIGGGDRQWEARRRLEDEVVAFVREHPGSSGAVVEGGVEGKAVAIRAALRQGVVGHRLRVEDGPKGAHLHWANS